jgi:hypothetical protein
MLLNEIAIIHVPEHQRGNGLSDHGHRMADEAAKEVALQSKALTFHLTLALPPPPSATPWFNPQEEKQLVELGN